MLEDSRCAPEMALEKSQRCEPDYEAMVKRITQRIKKTETFKDAALLYFEGKIARNKMAELIGELVTEYNQLARERDSLISRQESAKK